MTARSSAPVRVRGLSDGLQSPAPGHFGVQNLPTPAAGGARFAQVRMGEIDDPIARATLGAGIQTTLSFLAQGGQAARYIGASRRTQAIQPKRRSRFSKLALRRRRYRDARLLDELRQSLQQQTATADVLKVISVRPSISRRSPGARWGCRTVARLCRADQAVMSVDLTSAIMWWRLVAFQNEAGISPPLILSRPSSTLSGRVELERGRSKSADVLARSEYTLPWKDRRFRLPQMLGIPLLREQNLDRYFR